MAKGEVYRFRLEADERQKLERDAKRLGAKSVADLIRSKLGLKPNRPLPKEASKGTKKLLDRPTTDGADKATEPGKAAIESLAKKIRGRDGLTMPVARRKAQKELEDDG